MTDDTLPPEEFDPPAFIEDAPFTSADFHTVIHKHVLNAVYDTLADSKLPWEAIVPFLETAREMCRADFAGAAIGLHHVQERDGQWVEADEAYLGIAVNDRDTGAEWLSDTYWLSDIATQDENPEEVRKVIAALERSLAKMREWLNAHEKGGAAEATPPDTDSD
jgi:hypothetical protein